MDNCKSLPSFEYYYRNLMTVAYRRNRSAGMQTLHDKDGSKLIE